MPVISIFYGIFIYMYFDQHEHNPPHFHVKYQNYEASFTFDGELLKGDLPKKQISFVKAWAAIHEDDLKTNWELLKKEGRAEKIEPLR
ncbi:DUF4160 domain-containing protein [Candidatus Saccharibacteria bacterium]|nr:DUF4160 domain-containing protein [Candidatus Saccharibacteria bacterium]